MMHPAGYGGAQVQFGGSHPGGQGGGQGGYPSRFGGGSPPADRGQEISQAVNMLTADEARGKVALLTEELKQMKLMNTEIKLVKDALRRQQKELVQLEREGAALQGEAGTESKRRVELARMLAQAKKDNPLLDPAAYPLQDEDLDEKPLHAIEEDEAAAVAAAEEVDAEMEKAAAAGMMGAPGVQNDGVMDDLLSLIMGNTAAGAELGLPSAPGAPAAPVFGAPVMPVATAGGESIQVREAGAGTAAPPQLLSSASPVLLNNSAAAPKVPVMDGAMSPHGGAISQDLFKSTESWTKSSSAPAPPPAASLPEMKLFTTPAPQPEPQPEPQPGAGGPGAGAGAVVASAPTQPPPHPSQVNGDDEGAI